MTRIQQPILAHESTVGRVLRKACTLAVLTALIAAVGCETSKPAEREAENNEAEDATSLNTDEILSAAQHARDRELDEPPDFERVDSVKMLPELPTPPAAVVEERALLAENLFGDRADDSVVALPFQRAARYDAKSHTIKYVNGKTNESTRKALFAAVVRAIDANQMEKAPEARGWDEYLARRAARESTVAFSLASEAAKTRDDVTPELMAARPDLVTELDDFRDFFGADPKHATGSLSQLERQFIVREAWTLSAALYRANGWSGVELAHLMPPDRSADVVQPGNWMSGEPIAAWNWPETEGSTASAAGTVGAAATSFWLANTVSNSVLRTLFAGWVSDAYRLWPATETRPERFEWLTLWDSPGSASQVTKAFELTLRERFPNEPESHFVVFQKGLKVGVIISDESAEQRRDRARRLLSTKVQFQSREGLPLEFEPTRLDVLARKRANAKVVDGTWTDPASGLAMSMEPLDAWKLDEPKASTVRWFARHSSGALIQLTMEIENPLGPDFGEDAYREELRKAFGKTVQEAGMSGISSTEMTFGRALTATVTGELDGQKTKLKFWHFKIGDLVFTYSYQAPAAAFGEYVDAARAVIDSADVGQESTKPSKTDASEGIIEFEVED